MGGSRSLTVRMYNVGFGDCFLVTFRDDATAWRMLIDCGVHNQGHSAHDISDVVASVIEAATGSDGPRIDVVVATHRHRDHISGFEDDRWHQVNVGQVWLPWTEDPEDQEALRLRQQHDAAALALQSELAADDECAQLAMNSLTNEQAMWTLQRGFSGTPRRRYLAASGMKREELPGLRQGYVYFLGPPRNEDALRDLNPPRAQRWFQATAGTRAGNPQPPFAQTFRIQPAEFAERYGDRIDLPSEKLLKRLLPTDVQPLAAASWLDRAINNTSVLFVLEVGAARLLFPGDSQWGAWQELVDNPEVRALLRQVSVYKVSHHGSHNGTPTILLREILPSSVTALVSVHPVERWPKVPKAELIEALRAPNRTLVSSGDDVVSEPVRRHPDGLWIEVEIPT